MLGIRACLLPSSKWRRLGLDLEGVRNICPSLGICDGSRVDAQQFSALEESDQSESCRNHFTSVVPFSSYI